MNQMMLGPVSFQGMRPQQTAASEAPAEADGGQTRGMLVSGKSKVDPRLIAHSIHRPYAHHEAENLLCAVHDMAGNSWGNTGNTLPGHIAKSLKSFNEFHETWG